MFAIVPAVEGALPFQGDLRLIVDLFERGVRIVGLTWNSRNEVAVGLNSARRADAVRGAGGRADERPGHPDRPRPCDARDVLGRRRASRAPLYNSHSNTKAVWKNERNLDNAQLDAIRGSGRAVGVTFCPTFVAAHPVTLDEVMVQLESLLQRAGDASVQFGADFADYFVEEMKAEIDRHPNLYDLEVLRYPSGIETVRVDGQNVIIAMRRRGLPGAHDRERRGTDVPTGARDSGAGELGRRSVGVGRERPSSGHPVRSRLGGPRHAQEPLVRVSHASAGSRRSTAPLAPGTSAH